MYIDDGINIDPAFENHIGFSIDGLDWNFIHKDGLSVVRTLRNQGTTNPPSVIGQQKMTLISLVDITGSTRLSFDCNNVVNQAGWQGQTNAALNQAVSDITGWLNANSVIGAVTIVSSVETPGISSANGAGTVVAGFRSVTIWNSGVAAGTIEGVSIGTGAVLSWGAALNNTLDEINYNATGTTFIITTTL